MKRIGGFILITTLMMIMIISLLLLTRLQALLLYTKITARHEIYHQDFYRLESLAKKLMANNPSQLPHRCRREMDDPNEALKRLKQNKACLLTENQMSYLYFIEDLGIQPCLVVQRGKRQLSSHHWRYTLGFIKEGEINAVLQTRMIVSAKRNECMQTAKPVKTGISSWRYLPSLADFTDITIMRH